MRRKNCGERSGILIWRHLIETYIGTRHKDLDVSLDGVLGWGSTLKGSV